MARIKPIQKIKRLQLNRFRQVGTDSNGRPKLEIYFKNIYGSNYVWTPVINEGTLRLFQLGCQVETNEKQSNLDRLENNKKVSKYLSLAIKIGKALYPGTSLEEVRNVAKRIFAFDLAPSVHFTMPDIVAQEIYDWIITLSEQPISDDEKMRLIRKFATGINSLASPEVKQT